MPKRSEGQSRSRVLEHVRSHPSRDAHEIADAMGIPYGTVSGSLSDAYREREIGRKRGPKGDFIYGAGADFPRRGDNGATPIVKRTKRVNAKQRATVGVLITIQYGRNESVTLTREEAEQVFDQLKGVFVLR